MPGFSNNTMFADNVSFDGTANHSGKVTADGQLLIGSTATPHIKVGTLSSTDSSVVITPGSGTIDLSASGVLLDGQQIFYVGKGGNDANSGTNIDVAKLTFTNAIATAAALTPSATNKIAIVCFDDGIYTENLTTVSYVDIYAPNATIVGYHTIADFVNFKVKKLSYGIGIPTIIDKSGSDYSSLDVGTIEGTAGSIELIRVRSGTLNLKFNLLTQLPGAIGNVIRVQAGRLILNGGDIITNGAVQVITTTNAASVIDGSIGMMKGALTDVAMFHANGYCNLFIDEIQGYTVSIRANGGVANIYVGYSNCVNLCETTAGSELYLFVGKGSAGTVINGGGILKLFRGDGQSYTSNLSSTGLTDSSRTAKAVAVYGAGGALSEVGPLTNGQLIIGSTGLAPAAAALIPGPGIAITNGAGTITVGAWGGGLSWTTKGASTPLVNNNAFICTAGGALSFSLPTTSAVGDIISIVLDGSTSWTITQSANQQIRVGALQTTLGAGGSLASTAQGDSVTLVCKTANLLWTAVYGVIGNLTVV